MADPGWQLQHRDMQIESVGKPGSSPANNNGLALTHQRPHDQWPSQDDTGLSTILMDVQKHHAVIGGACGHHHLQHRG